LGMGYSPRLPSMSGLGYKELSMHLADELTLEEAAAATKNATHDFIRRQYTWFRGHDQGIVWADAAVDVDTILQTTQAWLEQVST
jgi:tRNA dimethylallyltransferase